jgi:hypothetical protein
MLSLDLRDLRGDPIEDERLVVVERCLFMDAEARSPARLQRR